MAFSNDETWTVALLIDNDRVQLEHVLNAAKLAWNSRNIHPNVIDGICDAETAARTHLTEVLKSWMQGNLEIYENKYTKFPYTLMISLAQQAFNRVDWKQLAQHYLDQIK